MSEFEYGRFVGRMGTVDSASFLIEEIMKPVKLAERILALVGCYYAAKGTWYLTTHAYRFLRLYCFVPSTLPYQSNFAARYGQFALISNVSDGLSTNIALALADRGINLILVGADPEHLYFLEHKLRNEYGVFSIALITTAHHTFLISQMMKIIKKYEVGILVNYLGDIDSTDNFYGNCNPLTEWGQIPKSVGKTMMLARFVLPGMYSRGRGVIVNVLPTRMSMTAQRLPYSVTAMSSLSFVQTLGDSIRASYSFRGIKVQNVTPYMDAIIGTREEFERSLKRAINFQPTSSEYAKSLVSLIGQTENTHGHWFHSVYYGLSQYLPDFMMKKVRHFVKSYPELE